MRNLKASLLFDCPRTARERSAWQIEYQCTKCGNTIDVGSTKRRECGNGEYETVSGGDSVNDPYPDTDRRGPGAIRAFTVDPTDAATVTPRVEERVTGE